METGGDVNHTVTVTLNIFLSARLTEAWGSGSAEDFAGHARKGLQDLRQFPHSITLLLLSACGSSDTW